MEQLIQKVIFGEKEVADAENEIDSLSIERTREEIKRLAAEALALKVDVAWSNEIFKVSEENKLIWFLEGSVYDDNGVFTGKKMFSAYSPERGEIKSISPAVGWDLKPSKKEADDKLKGLLTLRPKVLSEVIRGEFEEYREMLKFSIG